jgi:hypothetical protein
MGTGLVWLRIGTGEFGIEPSGCWWESQREGGH